MKEKMRDARAADEPEGSAIVIDDSPKPDWHEVLIDGAPITRDEFNKSSDARLCYYYLTDAGMMSRTPAVRFDTAKSRFIKQRSQWDRHVAYGERVRAYNATKPKRTRPRSGISFGAEINSALQVRDGSLIEDMLDPTYWSNSYIPRTDEQLGGSATLSVGRKMDILDPITGEPRGIRLEVTECIPGVARDQHIVRVKVVE